MIAVFWTIACGTAPTCTAHEGEWLQEWTEIDGHRTPVESGLVIEGGVWSPDGREQAMTQLASNDACTEIEVLVEGRRYRLDIDDRAMTVHDGERRVYAFTRSDR